jgi:DNA-binding transcriptional LysR family regulator
LAIEHGRVLVGNGADDERAVGDWRSGRRRILGGGTAGRDGDRRQRGADEGTTGAAKHGAGVLRAKRNATIDPIGFERYTRRASIGNDYARIASERGVDFAWLTAFVTVAREGGFSRAAEVLHVSQSGISRQVQRLERELGAVLLERGGAVRLTAVGQRVLIHTEAALAAREAMTAAAAAGALAGPLRIAASTTPGEYLAPELVAGFVREHPKVEPHVLILDTVAVEEEVRAGRCDLGFVGARLDPRGLRYRAVLDDEVVLAVPADHPLAKAGSIALADLVGLPFLDREGGSGTAASVRRVLKDRGLALPDYRPVMTLGSGAAIVAAVERGLGVGWVSTLALNGRDPGRVAAVRLAGVHLARSLFMIESTTTRGSPAADAFARRVEESRSRDERVVSREARVGDSPVHSS